MTRSGHLKKEYGVLESLQVNPPRRIDSFFLYLAKMTTPVNENARAGSSSSSQGTHANRRGR